MIEYSFKSQRINFVISRKKHRLLLPILKLSNTNNTFVTYLGKGNINWTNQYCYSNKGYFNPS